jgi:hypothetical protein
MLARVISRKPCGNLCVLVENNGASEARNELPVFAKYSYHIIVSSAPAEFGSSYCAATESKRLFPPRIVIWDAF